MKKPEWLKGFTAGVFVTVMCLVVIGLATMGHARAQEKPAPPAMSAETGNKLRDVVLEQAKLVIQLKDTITTYNNLQGALNAQAKKVDDAKAAALKEAKLDPEKWDVDLDKFSYVPRVVPTKPAAPAKPEVKP